MKFKVLNDLASDGIILYYMTIFKNLFTNLDMRLVTLLIILFCFLGAVVVRFFINKFISVRNIKGEMMLTGLIFILTLIAIFISLCIYAVLIMLSNHYYGKHEADVQPVAVHNGKNDKGKWESLVTLEDKAQI
jgi:polyferredoxin